MEKNTLICHHYIFSSIVTGQGSLFKIPRTMFLPCTFFLKFPVPCSYPVHFFSIQVFNVQGVFKQFQSNNFLCKTLTLNSLSYLKKLPMLFQTCPLVDPYCSLSMINYCNNLESKFNPADSVYISVLITTNQSIEYT